MDKISLKTPKEIAIMAEGGEKLAGILEEVLQKIEPGLNTLQIDSWIEKKITDFGGKPSFKSVPRYHWASCTGINEEVVHSIPKKDKIIKDGDLLKIDLGMIWRGFHSDLAWTVLVSSRATKPQGNKDKRYKEKQKFLEVGKRALNEAIKVARPGKRVGHISQAIEETTTKAGYRPVEILTGHGIGKNLHENPLIPGVLRTDIVRTPELVPGMSLAIEIIYAQKSPDVVISDDGWTILTKDSKMSGLFEKTIVITKNKPLILTKASRGSFLC